MTTELSKTQIDRLGDRLKKDNIEEADLRLLDLYRRSFTHAYEIVVGAIRKELALEPTGRPSKTTTSIADKLRRESIRLTQIQDIAGCRLIVADIATQNAVVQSLSKLFQQTIIVDRRERPSNGYRAVHVVVKIEGVVIEVQVRTSLQHLWAELSEKISDIVDPSIKYGGGDDFIRGFLKDTSAIVAAPESVEMKFAETQLHWSSTVSHEDDSVRQTIIDVRDGIDSLRQRTYKQLRDAIEVVEEAKRKHDALFD